MISSFVHQHGKTTTAPRVDPAWLEPSSWGMNVPLPHFPGPDTARFWWVAGIMAAIAAIMLAVFRANRWI